ncbi:branched-chain amino acid transport [Methylobacterium sp. 4-46]|uniref:AzlD family protein n=1 Tax=unclassified Methylobacterium TaxID=2615210 RepID=UPI000152DF73|nr:MULTISPECIES: AzlD domain-containing protein [Methylobacterium]ACA16618.1 branched-chain amino acid transport [Methylobacterium sp. 4-46]WFT82322.1 AzlD domain-containing protein [Methylobacterium nodulans]
MSAQWLAGPAGSLLAVAALTAVTYLCRASGVLLMSRVRLTPRVERGLRALPGSIVVATALPTGLAAGAPGIAGLAAAAAVMALTRFELAAIAAGLAVVALGRAAGL